MARVHLVYVQVFPKGWDKTFCLRYVDKEFPVRSGGGHTALRCEALRTTAAACVFSMLPPSPLYHVPS